MRRFIPFAAALVLGVSACSPDTGKGRTSSPTTHRPLEPCHPGCFPAGTPVATPDGPRPIESIRGGDLVTLIGPDGAATSGAVSSTFQTCNRLVEVRTESGSLLTTETQPLCLAGGEFRRAGELAEGDRVWRWEGGGRRAARALAVVPTGREAAVFNLVVGDSAVFVAGGFLARGKPPPDGSQPGQAQ
jgi:hypothetical protein